MFTPLNTLLERYTKRFKSGSHTTLFSIKDEWPNIAKTHRIDPQSVSPTALRDKTLTLSCSSSEEAAHVRMMQRHIIAEIRNKTHCSVNKIVFK